MTFEEFLIVECKYTDLRIINDGTEYIAIASFIFTHAIVKGTVGNIHNIDDRWCYHTYWNAKKYFDIWNGIGEPDGWHRHPKTGRRREQGKEEYINF